MNKAMWDKWAPFSGIVFVALLVATFFSPAKSPPNAGDSPDKWLSFFQDHRTALLISAYLSGLAVVFFLFFLGSLVTRLRATGEQRLAAVTLGGGIVLAGVGLMGCAIQASLAWTIGHDATGAISAGDVKMLNLVPMFAFAFPLAAFAGAASIAAWRSNFWPSWFSQLGLVAALWFIVAGAALSMHGFFSPHGAFGFIAFLAFLVWMLLASAFMLAKPSKEEVPAAAHAAM